MSATRGYSMSRTGFKAVSMVLFILSLLSQGCGESEPPVTADIFIAPDGDDRASGSFHDPLTSLGAARDAVRELRQEHPERSDILVLIRGGAYRLDETVVFGLEDGAPAGGSITYAAYPGETPVFTAGIPIKEWKKTDAANLPDLVPFQVHEAVWTAPVPEGLDRFYTLYDTRGSLPRARSEGMQPTNGDGTWEYMGKLHDPDMKITVQMPEGFLKDTGRLKDIELCLVPTAAWSYNILPVASYDPSTCRALLSTPATYGVSRALFMPEDFESLWIENAFGCLDEPGEWVLDSESNSLYFIPRDVDSPPEGVVAPSLTEFIRVEGDIRYNEPTDEPVRNIVFRGLTFTCGDRYTWSRDHVGWGLQHDWEMFDSPSAVIRFRGAEGCAVEECTITESGGSGIRFDLHCTGNRVSGTELSNLGGTGVLLAGYGFGTKDVNRNNEITDCHIHHVGRIYWPSMAVFVWQSGSNRISHNHIHHTPYAAVVISGRIGLDRSGQSECSKSVRWHEIDPLVDFSAGHPGWHVRKRFLHGRNNVVEYNDMHDVMQKLFDGNYIYISGTGDGNLVRGNYLHDTDSETICSSIRCDDDQNGTTIEGNLITRNRGMGNGIAIKGVNHVINNIIADLQPHHDHRGLISLELSSLVGTEIKQNVLYATNNDVRPYLQQRLYGNGAEPRLRDCVTDSNLYFSTVDPAWGNRHLETERAFGIEGHSMAADPLFVDPENGDYSFRDDSPAHALGIEPFDMSLVGPREK